MIDKTYPIAEKLILNALQMAQQLRLELNREADALKKAHSPELINTIATNKKQLVAQLEQFSSQIAQVLSTENLPNSQDSIKEYFARAERSGLATAESLQNWDRLMLVCSECRSLNDQNGASINLLSLNTKRSLDILKGKPEISSTYGSDGTSKSDYRTRPLISV